MDCSHLDVKFLVQSIFVKIATGAISLSAKRLVGFEHLAPRPSGIMWGRAASDRFKAVTTNTPGPGTYDVKVEHNTAAAVLGSSERFKEAENEPLSDCTNTTFAATEAPDVTRHRLSTNLKAMSMKVWQAIGDQCRRARALSAASAKPTALPPPPIRPTSS